MSSELNPTGRFSDRVAYYVKHRPRYPAAAVGWIIAQANIAPPEPIADVGSGTGILSEALLERGFSVYGVEPNPEMRAAGEDYLRGHEKFISVDATAEQTTLDSGSISAITAGQAFHWFDLPATKAEFQRILKPGGVATLIWNNWQNRDDPLAEAYRALLTEYGIDFEKTHHARINDAHFAAFFSSSERATFSNPQHYDLDGLKGRSLSASYSPLQGHPNHTPLVAGLEALFDEFQQHGQVTFQYETEVYAGWV